ncbi:bifunctional phosphopantothenoylcysteine decarboxylase/phosphopantothenate--cysteine ligase CoaBC [Mycoplasmopsis cricetuli]|uniref:bifunctional phosphopantothenoylcysteine decarboxylase/phosphopantothenate--cysteine ligase CoaBC n=1 Tax=Mycoplasmopsis cricetuli TaxID=171283 RepID=UPI00046FA768|nr:bifunctional phosphopantothenoylcysteine decarboxylase/phosphopantothenate--cysteine ligase CoaBC [Mycoplasmopsis cricetuli]
MKILVLITGSIASIKSKKLINLLEKNNHEVKYALTDSAYNFVNQSDFPEALNKIWYQKGILEHIEAVLWADLIIVYPITYNTLNKIALGINDNFITAIFSTQCFQKTIMCPAMNKNMYYSEVLQKNIKKLINNGVIFIGPESGQLKDGMIGIGRVSEPERVIDFIENKKGPKILLTYGYTTVKLDPVRVVSVPSSGKTGILLIHELAKFANLTVISGNLKHLNNKIPSSVKVINIETVNQYYEAVDKYIVENDFFISLCAVSDLIFKPKLTKIKKNEKIAFEYKIGRDVLKSIALKYPNKIKIGFALESNDLLKNGLEKLDEKKLNAIVINDSNSLKNNTSSGYLVIKNEKPIFFENLNKNELAQKIAKMVEQLWKK